MSSPRSHDEPGPAGAQSNVTATATGPAASAALGSEAAASSGESAAAPTAKGSQVLEVSAVDESNTTLASVAKADGEPVQTSSESAAGVKETGWGDAAPSGEADSAASAGKHPEAEPTNGHVDTSASTPGLDPTASVFEPKQPTTQQNGEAEEPTQQRPRKEGGYNNPNRVDTGGLRKAKLTPDELTERMAKARERNAELLKKREAVDADEAAWKDEEAASQKALEEERAAREAKTQRLKEVQSSVDEARARNAARKMEKLSGRAWDAEKDPETFAKGSAPVKLDDQEYDYNQHLVSNSRGRGGAGRGRGGRGRGGHQQPSRDAKPAGVNLDDATQFPSILRS